VIGARITSVHIGSIMPLGPDRVPSAFVKEPVMTPVEVTALGLVGDAQADLRVHGGPEKAVYGYPTALYAAWRAEYPQHTALLAPGGSARISLLRDWQSRISAWAISMRLAAPCSRCANRGSHASSLRCALTTLRYRGPWREMAGAVGITEYCRRGLWSPATL